MLNRPVKYRHLSLAVKYAAVLFPFDIPDFLRNLSKQGFVLPKASRRCPLGAVWRFREY